MRSSRPTARTSVAATDGLARGNAVLREILVELALTLLPCGITPRTFSELARQAFACAAARISQHSNEKINYSRIAALTGLSRADVKRLLQSSNRTSLALRFTQMPIERVLQGWREDRRFLGKDGTPKVLRISGTSNSFAALTRLYGGDVPHRAILEELRRIGAVRQVGQNVTLVRRERPRVASLMSALPGIIDGIRGASAVEGSRAHPAMYRLTIPAKSELDLTLVRERCISTVATMLNGLGESLGGQLTRPAQSRGGSQQFVVTVLLAQNKGHTSDPSRTQGNPAHVRTTSNKARNPSIAAQRN